MFMQQCGDKIRNMSNHNNFTLPPFFPPTQLIFDAWVEQSRIQNLKEEELRSLSRGGGHELRASFHFAIIAEKNISQTHHIRLP